MCFLDKESFKKDYEEKFSELFGIELSEGTEYNKYEALGSLIRDYIAKMWINTEKIYQKSGVKQIYYFSMEFLLGRLLVSNLINLGIREICQEALNDIGIDLKELEELEHDQGLGNGGLGRLAACFLDSMASLGIPGHGCGIRFKYGFFEQKIIGGNQVEYPDNWLKDNNVWEIRRADKAVVVKFGGTVNMEKSEGRLIFTHVNYEPVLAVPYDTPIVGYKNGVVNNLRLWSAEPLGKEIDFSYFRKGDFLKAMEYKNSIEAISQVLYPDDSFEEGRILRLKQEYFLVSAGIQRIVKNYKKAGHNIRDFHEKIAIHINDTHPALAIPELMRILMDEEGLGWDEAFMITEHTISYTNHTILSEAMEKWPVDTFKSLLPRIYMIVEELNERFCRGLWNEYTGQWDKISRMAIISDGYVRMDRLAIVGSHSVNGVAKIHTEILKKKVMADFYYYTPHKFNNKTNGISHRRWLIQANPDLTSLLKETIGDSFINHPTDINYFQKYADDPTIHQRLYDIKRSNKLKLCDYIMKTCNIKVDPDSLFDVQIKRIHAYKRQTLNAFHIMDLYNRLIENPDLDIQPRTFIFAGKAAPSYYLAKKIITLINRLAEKINNDARVKDKIKVVFLDNYRVSLAEKIIPAADLSEQISTATKEASGTGNMKFMMNGALTIATLDGANIEIKDLVGENNMFIFGLKSEEVLKYSQYGGYSPVEIMKEDDRIRRISQDLINGMYSSDFSDFLAIYDSLYKYNDEYFVLKDFSSYVDAQAEVDKVYRDFNKWYKMVVINIANSGTFSSDRTIKEYATGIWGLRYPDNILNEG
ncbi:glycogen phosphorylase [Fervidicella metallireducens AeB]|uniref:Alpha-1,4 glucan phosphorylase n=1 Tax=Fervidicella metallireducens AeB TaxID=1403537 RepID=A0A017RSY0_9CLOT|nr:glycogen/starch/alpha-glucan phosphorylase [Fervidicella metallireducens]EYE87772.1 glycogen phosphorylase [Fervidicella metallireducens AeB]